MVLSMNILFLITGLAMGGAENQVVAVADNLERRGHKVTLAYILQPALIVPQSKNIDVIWLGGDKSFLGMAKALFSFTRLVKKIKPDVVHSHMFHANVLARVARLFAPVPWLVCTAHNTNEGGRLRMLIYRATHKLANVFTNVSQDSVTAFEAKKAAPKDTMLVTHNGIDTDKFSFSEETREQKRNELELVGVKIFIAIGRFHQQKDYPNLFNAFAQVLKYFDGCKLLVVGDGELRSELETLLCQLSIQESVQLLGVRYDVPKLLSAADVYVLSSTWEGFPLVVGEALSTERVVVTTDAGGAREFLTSHDFLVPVNNSEALASAMIKALSLSGEEAERLGKEGRLRIINKYSLDAVVDKWEEIYLNGSTYDN